MQTLKRTLLAMTALFLLQACESSTARLPAQTSLEDVKSNCPNLPLFSGKTAGDLFHHDAGDASMYYSCRASYKALVKSDCQKDTSQEAVCHQ